MMFFLRDMVVPSSDVQPVEGFNVKPSRVMYHPTIRNDIQVTKKVSGSSPSCDIVSTSYIYYRY